MQTNTRRAVAKRTHEGAPAARMSPIRALRQLLSTCMLWEGTFYLNGSDVAEQITEAVRSAALYDVGLTADVIIEARTDMNIRHAPLLAAVTLGQLASESISVEFREHAKRALHGAMRRADEMAEVLAMAGGRKAPHFIMKAVRAKFESDAFDEYQLAKYQGKGRAITLKDALRLTHPRSSVNPLVAKIAEGTLATPNTWETRLSAGEDPREVFESLLRANKLGSMALLRNLRNMHEAGVDANLIHMALHRADWSKVLPFRFISAVQSAPAYARWLDAAFTKAVAGSVWLPGHTAVLIDHSGSMSGPISERSTVRMREVANALAAAINGDSVDVIVWGTNAERVHAWPGLSGALSFAANVGWGTDVTPALELAAKGKPDRVIVLTDMQLRMPGRLPAALRGAKKYTVNMMPYTNPGVIEGEWTALSGWSDKILNWIGEVERR